MSRLHVVSMMRNEADRYLRSALAAWSDFADSIVLLDDDSTDGSREVAAVFDKVRLFVRGAESEAWGSESSARALLFDLAMEHSDAGDVLLWLDTDMVPLRDPRKLLHPGVNLYLFPLYDLWGEDQFGRLTYREDGHWMGHIHWRPWMIRRPASSFVPEWSTRGVHCGHLPLNVPMQPGMMVPRDYALLHYAYHDAELRFAKHARYVSVADQLSKHELAHAMSILDSNPILKPLTETPAWTLSRSAPDATAASFVGSSAACGG